MPTSHHLGQTFFDPAQSCPLGLGSPELQAESFPNPNPLHSRPSPLQGLTQPEPCLAAQPDQIGCAVLWHRGVLLGPCVGFAHCPPTSVSFFPSSPSVVSTAFTTRSCSSNMTRLRPTSSSWSGLPRTSKKGTWWRWCFQVS